MEKLYRIAGVDLSIDIPQEQMYEQEHFLAPFRVAQVESPHRFEFRTVETLDPPEGELVAALAGKRVYREGKRWITYAGSVGDGWENGILRVLHHGKQHRIQVRASSYPQRIGVKAVLNSIEIEKLVTEAGGFVLHCAFVEADGRAILFTAPSGVGKSTQAELWRKLRGAQIVNGDRAVVRCVGGKVLACGIPFAGSSCYCQNRELEVAALVYLRQAPVTTIRPLLGYEAFARIWEGCSVHVWEPEQMASISDLVAEAATVPVYQLSCTPDESAVRILENELRRRVAHENQKQ